MSPWVKPLVLVSALGLAACVTVPTGPSQMALPGTGKSFDQFRYDDGSCRQYSYDQVGGQTAQRAQEDSGVKSAVVGTAIGALAGAAIGGSHGAAVGAGVGLLGGSVAGASASNVSAYDLQRRYDMAYVQCMYAKGHKVPTSGRFTTSTPPAYAPRYSAPPPPAGAPPPPPPGY